MTDDVGAPDRCGKSPSSMGARLGVRPSRRGATSVEYALMVALLAAICILSVRALGLKTNNAFERTDSSLTPP
jgi:Flp pilus assembly pilin Flp